jgi:O-antigen ligase
VCALIALPIVATGLVSFQGSHVPFEPLKDVAFLFAVALCVRGREGVERSTVALAVVGVFLGVGAVYSVLAHPLPLFPLDTHPYDPTIAVGRRAAGPFGDPNFFALSLAALVPLAMYLVSREGARRILGIVAAVCLIGGVFASGSRGALIAATLSLVGFAVLSGAPALRRITLLVVVIGVVLVPVFASQVQSSEQRTVAGRATANLVAIAMFADHPASGVGPRRYPDLYRGYARRIGNDAQEPSQFNSIERREAHSLPLEIAAEQGLIGIAGWLAAAILLIRLAAAAGVARSLLGRSVILSICAYMVGSLFLHGADLRALYMLVGLLLALAGAAPKKPQPAT